jgi:hypothetical protein
MANIKYLLWIYLIEFMDTKTQDDWRSKFWVSLEWSWFEKHKNWYLMDFVVPFAAIDWPNVTYN